MEPPVISVRNLQKFYGRQRVLSIDRLDLAFNAGITLCGSNGSGKSTLLRLIAGISLPTVGTITRDMNRLGLLGYVPQAGGLVDELSVEQNLDQRRRICGLREDVEAKEEVLARAGLLDSRKKRFADLSGGRQRLAALAAALYIRPNWLLVDEPFASIDEQRRSEVERLIEECTSRIALLVITSPESAEFPFAKSKIVSLVEGRMDASDA